jgi:stress response protein YsnF
MTLPATPAPDPPFPGAHSQVPRAHSHSAASTEPLHAGRRILPVQAACSPVDAGWVVLLPVRAEQVTVTKEVVAYERVVVRRRRVGETANVNAGVRREELRTNVEGEIDVTERPSRQLGSEERPASE